MKNIVGAIIFFFCAFQGMAQNREPMAFSEQPAAGSSIRLYPNPAIEYVHVKTDNLEVQNIKFSLHNLIGNEVHVEIEVVNSNEIRFRVKDLASGYYLLALRDEETRFKGTYKFLKR